jgi:hypothetical protein
LVSNGVGATRKSKLSGRATKELLNGSVWRECFMQWIGGQGEGLQGQCIGEIQP